MREQAHQQKRIFIIAGEHSGDALGGKLMQALKAQLGSNNIKFQGLGGEAMQNEGLTSLFSIDEVAVMGPVSIVARLPNLIKRGLQLVEATISAEPDALIIIDSPELTHRVAKRVRAKAPDIPIINYVSPTIWAWRPGRAKKMRGYIEDVLALLPFEPEKHRDLEGPPCHYVGHPLIELKPWIDKLDEGNLATKLGIKREQPILVVLPGSRPNEVKHLAQPFGQAIQFVEDAIGPIEVIIPTVASVRNRVEDQVIKWNRQVHFIDGQDDKFAAFKLANVALAASGTVTLELALSGTPMVVAYKVGRVLQALKFVIKTDMIALANLVLGYKCFPELVHKQCNAIEIAAHIIPLFSPNSNEFKTQQQGLKNIVAELKKAGPSPSTAAAQRVIKILNKFQA